MVFSPTLLRFSASALFLIHCEDSAILDLMRIMHISCFEPKGIEKNMLEGKKWLNIKYLTDYQIHTVCSVEYAKNISISIKKYRRLEKGF